MRSASAPVGQSVSRHLPQLDGVRGLAILIVILGHLIAFHFGFGIYKLGALAPTGVNLFFVLSGFLITNILISTRESNRYYLSFYARRALRIWPLYAAVLVTSFAILNHRFHPFTFNSSLIRWPFFALFIQNLVYVNDMVKLEPMALAVTWSLAVEEQFYLLWPVTVRNLRLKTLIACLAGIILFAPFARFLAPRLGGDVYTNPLCRFDGMATGGLIALWLHFGRPTREQVIRVTKWLLAIGLIGCALAGRARLDVYLNKTFLNAVFGGLLLSTLTVESVARVFSAAWIRYCGKISYGAYLLHVFVAETVGYYLPGHGWKLGLLRSVLILVGTLLIAAASWHFFESPILQWKRYFPPSTTRLGNAEAAASMNETLHDLSAQPVALSAGERS